MNVEMIAIRVGLLMAVIYCVPTQAAETPTVEPSAGDLSESSATATPKAMGSSNPGLTGPSYPQDIEIQALRQRLHRSKIMKGFGIGLSVTGASTIVAGVVIIVVSAVDAANTDPNEPTMGPALGYLLGGGVAAAGALITGIGIPLWAVGSKRKSRAQEKLDRLPSISLMLQHNDFAMVQVGWRL